MSRKQEIAKIAREIKSIKAELSSNKTAKLSEKGYPWAPINVHLDASSLGVDRSGDTDATVTLQLGFFPTSFQTGYSENEGDIEDIFGVTQEKAYKKFLKGLEKWCEDEGYYFF